MVTTNGAEVSPMPTETAVPAVDQQYVGTTVRKKGATSMNRTKIEQSKQFSYK